MKPIKSLILLTALTFSLIACKDNEVKKDSEKDEVNVWIYRQMKYWYFWNEEIPSELDYNLTNSRFYNSMLNEADHFSFYYEDYQTLINYLNGVSLESGFEFKLYRDAENANRVYGIILYIKPNSPASDLGLKRGDIFRAINSTNMTIDNYSALIDDMNSNYTLSYERYDSENDEWEAQPDLEVSPIEYSENPFLIDTVLEQNGAKVAYLVYNFFAPGATESGTEYADEMESIFGKFKSANVSRIIVDLRFNSGGSETSLRNLANHLIPSANLSNYIMKKQYNAIISEVINNDASLGEDFLNISFSEKPNSIGDMIKSEGITFITSSRSASASEALINALRPFQKITIIGDTTVGKDVGSVTLYDENNERSKIGLQPIVVKLVNDLNQDYPEGFTPDIYYPDNDKILAPLGSQNEPLLNAALDQIVGTTTRKHARHSGQLLLGTSFGRERGFQLTGLDLSIQ